MREDSSLSVVDDPFRKLVDLIWKQEIQFENKKSKLNAQGNFFSQSWPDACAAGAKPIKESCTYWKKVETTTIELSWSFAAV